MILGEGLEIERVLPNGMVVVVDESGQRKLIDPSRQEELKATSKLKEQPWTKRSTLLPVYGMDLITDALPMPDEEESDPAQQLQDDDTRRHNLQRRPTSNPYQEPGLLMGKDEPDNRFGSRDPGLTGAVEPQYIPRARTTRQSGTMAYPSSRPENQTLQAGDTVRIVTWGGVTINDTFPISPEGNLAVPGFGSLPLAGLRRVEAQQAVTELLRSHYKHAGALLNVDQAAHMAVTVLGEVTRPGMHLVPANASLLACLSAAGGSLRRGSLRHISVTEPGAEARQVDLYALATGRSAEPLQSLRPQTMILVPLAGPQIQVFGAVKRSYSFELDTDSSLAQALDWAGGLEATADAHRIRLLRENADGQNLLLYSQSDLAQLPAQDGDRLHVGTKPAMDDRYDSVTIDGEVQSPGTYPADPGMTIEDALRLAGGINPRADREKAFIIRHLKQPERLQLNAEVSLNVYEDLVTNLSADTPIHPLDTIVVPERPTLMDSTLQVQISGAIKHPGYYPLLPDMYAGDLIRMAGGVLASSQVDEADLVRVVYENDVRTVIRFAIDLRPILNKRADGPALRNGDTLVVRTTAEERISVILEGEIANTGSYVLPAGTSLAQALAIAGGLTEWAFPAGARFYRENEAEAAKEHLLNLIQQMQSSKAINQNLLNKATDPIGREQLERTIVNQEIELGRMKRAQVTGRMTGVDMRGILSHAPAADFTLQDGDRLQVPMRPGTVRVLGEVMTPGSIRFEDALQVQEVIQRSGGLTQQADENRIFVVRADGSVVASAAFSGTAWDPIDRRWVRTNIKKITLLEGDTVLVPPDLEYRINGMQLAKDWSQILFQVAATVGTIAVVGN